MEYYKNELCVTYEELTSGDDPVVKYETLKSNSAWLLKRVPTDKLKED